MGWVATEGGCSLQTRLGGAEVVFATTIETVLEPRNSARVLDGLIGEARVPRIRLHDMRHPCPSWLLARVVMETLGHSQPGIPMNLY